MLEDDYGKFNFEELKNTDRFERHEYLSNLEKLIASRKDDCFVLQISGQYGSGKTFFINLLKKYLEDRKYNTLYYNAWEHDYAQDAFISFCSLFVQHFDASTPDVQGLKIATQKLLVSYLPAILSFVCKTLWGIDAEQISNKVCNVAQNIDDNSQKIKKACNDLLDTELERENIVKEFRQALYKVIRQNNQEKQLIIFIDDLDRCKADFAIRLLDYIKHLFNIKGITFILAVDDEQLKSTVEKFYGSQNAAGYLRRIVDFEFKLPLANYKKFIHNLIQKYLFTTPINNDFLVNLLNNLAFIFDLSLRDLQYVFEQVHKTMNTNTVYQTRPYMYFVTFILEHYFQKYRYEIMALETENTKRLNNSQKLVAFFNHKFASSPYYTNSLFYDAPLMKKDTRDYSLQSVLACMVNIPNDQNYQECQKMFPYNSDKYDLYEKKTFYERIMLAMDEAQKDTED